MPGSPLLRRLLTVAALVVALGLLALGALYQADTSPEVIESGQGSPFPGQQTGGQPTAPSPPASEGPATPGATNPVEGWFPEGGQGAACTEAVGVDLAAGFQARLTINGRAIPDTELNQRGSAAGTLNHYTWGPEADCPRGALLRAQDNVLEACVWRLEEPADACRVYRYQFDAL